MQLTESELKSGIGGVGKYAVINGKGMSAWEGLLWNVQAGKTMLEGNGITTNRIQMQRNRNTLDPPKGATGFTIYFYLPK